MLSATPAPRAPPRCRRRNVDALRALGRDVRSIRTMQGARIRISLERSRAGDAWCGVALAVRPSLERPPSTVWGARCSIVAPKLASRKACRRRADRTRAETGPPTGPSMCRRVRLRAPLAPATVALRRSEPAETREQSFARRPRSRTARLPLGEVSCGELRVRASAPGEIVPTALLWITCAEHS